MKSHQEESRTDRVNTGGKPGNDKVKGGIEPLEVEAFKRRIKEGDRLYCYRPRRREPAMRPGKGRSASWQRPERNWSITG